MTKAARIRELYKTGKYTMRQIADMVGCRDSYVRVAARQRANGESDIDRRYKQSPKGIQKAKKYLPRKLARQNERYQTEPIFREKRLEVWRRWYRDRGGREWVRNYHARKAEARAQ